MNNQSPVDRYHNIVVVCTGNICRSPMAAALLRHRLSPRVHVHSVGTAALVNASADPLAQDVMRQHDIDLTNHRGRQASDATLTGVDLVLTAESFHSQWINIRYPNLRRRVFKLGYWLNDRDIADPFQRSRAVFEETYADIDACIRTWIPKLIG